MCLHLSNIFRNKRRTSWCHLTCSTPWWTVDAATALMWNHNWRSLPTVVGLHLGFSWALTCFVYLFIFAKSSAEWQNHRHLGFLPVQPTSLWTRCLSWQLEEMPWGEAQGSWGIKERLLKCIFEHRPIQVISVGITGWLFYFCLIYSSLPCALIDLLVDLQLYSKNPCTTQRQN